MPKLSNTNKNKKDYKEYLNKIYRVVQNQAVQVVALVILVAATTWMIRDLTFSCPERCFFVAPEINLVSSTTTDQAARGDGLVPRHLDGVLVANAASNSRPLALVIENHFESRPPSGLSRASLVYEILVEGGITRFLALYEASGLVTLIGPVRSCRTYYLNLAEEYQSLFVHVGGSPDCLDNIKRRVYDVYDLNQYFNGDYFWRNGRIAPHNVYTSTELLNKYLDNRGIDKPGEFESWLYKDPGASSSTQVLDDAKSLIIDYSIEAYKVEWQYDSESGDYRRHLAGEVHSDSDGAEIRAQNVIVQYVRTSLLDRIGRLDLKLEGRGGAVVFQDGKVIQGYWKKPDRQSRTKFYNLDGEEIAFNRGLSWVEVLPTDREVIWE